MADARWIDVDRYITDALVAPDRALDAALADSDAAGLPAIAVSPPHGKLLHLLALTLGAKHILEVGTLGGYSTIWLARGLAPGGRVISLELLDKHAEVARGNLERAGVAARVEVRVGKALDSLAVIAKEQQPPFDLVFIDADKQNNPEYFRWALQLTRPGSLIVVDNVVRDGAVIDAESKDEMVQGVRRLIDLVQHEPRVSATAIQTVGVKNYDGFMIARVHAAP